MQQIGHHYSIVNLPLRPILCALFVFIFLPEFSDKLEYFLWCSYFCIPIGCVVHHALIH